jgi:FtsP/CotA-like multicopper oxidase with cupredoxin domain
MKSMSILKSLPGVFRAGLAALLLGTVGQAQAYINGWEGTGAGTAADPRTFVLTAKQDFISTSDGGSHYAWGYSFGTDLPMQYPGPTLIVKQGDVVKIVLNNALPVPVSIVFPGLQGVAATGGIPGLMTREARAVPLSEKAVVAGPTYTFVADKAGTYLYNSGTQPELQIEMGLVGALIVRPADYDMGTTAAHASRKAYEQPGTHYDRENLFLLSEMDPAIHWEVYSQVFSNQPVTVDTSTIKPSMWFINGRNGPDTMLEDHVDWLPTQPYNALPRRHPGERLLMRVVSAGRDLHPFHHHGNHATPIARDGRVLSSRAPSDPLYLTSAPDVTSPDFTVRSIPGQTMDLIFEWTGKGIGWDVYGHAPGDPLELNEDPADHGKPIPVVLGGSLDVSYGESYSGSPFLGRTGSLPQGHPGLNTTGGYFHMWHSHNEKELTTDDIFPGGMMTMLIVEPWSVVLFEDQP